MPHTRRTPCRKTRRHMAARREGRLTDGKDASTPLCSTRSGSSVLSQCSSCSKPLASSGRGSASRHAAMRTIASCRASTVSPRSIACAHHTPPVRQRDLSPKPWWCTPVGAAQWAQGQVGGRASRLVSRPSSTSMQHWRKISDAFKTESFLHEHLRARVCAPVCACNLSIHPLDTPCLLHARNQMWNCTASANAECGAGSCHRTGRRA